MTCSDVGIKGSRWSAEISAHLDYLRRRDWHATFRDEDDATYYAWTHPGMFVVPSAGYLGEWEFGCFRWKER